MKKLLVLITALTMSTASFAAATGDIVISGIVEAAISIALSTNTYSTLDIVNGGDHSVAIATETCSDLAGYKIYGYSVNGSELINTTSSANKTAYTIKYDGAVAGVSLGAGSANRVELKDSGTLTASTTDTSTVVVDVTAFAAAPAGTYSDTITLQIEAN